MSPAAKKKPKEKIECCRAWMQMSKTSRDRWEWQATHQFGHSRTAFSVETLAEYARVPVERASELAKDAERMKWIWTPQEGVWVGRLGTRR